jgi:cell division protein FtsB
LAGCGSDNFQIVEADMWNKIFLSLVVIFLVFTLAVSVGLGVWAFSLNTQLTQARADYQKLKSSDDKLNTNYNDLNIKSTKDQTDLITAQAQIVDLQDQLKKAQAANDSLNARVVAIKSRISIVYTWQYGSDASFDAKVTASGDDQLKKLWEVWKKNETGENARNITNYIVQSLADAAD